MHLKFNQRKGITMRDYWRSQWKEPCISLQQNIPEHEAQKVNVLEIKKGAYKNHVNSTYCRRDAPIGKDRPSIPPIPVGFADMPRPERKHYDIRLDEDGIYKDAPQRCRTMAEAEEMT